jgi:thiamine-phosphate pyrophosphorylase
MPEMRKPSPLHGLYAVTPDGIDREILLAGVAAALRGGVKIVQYRDKKNKAAQRSAIALSLCALCRQFGSLFIVNDDLALALAVDADGVHLGADDGDLAAARRALGPGKLLGASCYADFDVARAAVAAGADYVAFGAAYPSPTKPHAARAPLSLFGRCRDELGVAACAIGGITLDNAPELIAAGAELLAVITDLFETPDIASRAMAFQQLFKGERT